MATPRSVPASQDGRVTSLHQLHLLRLLDGRYVAICSCRWTGGTYHVRRENAYSEAQRHALEHDVQLQFIELKKLEDVQPAVAGVEFDELDRHHLEHASNQVGDALEQLEAMQLDEAARELEGRGWTVLR